MESSQTHSQWAYRESFDQPVHQMQSFNRNGAIFEDEGILVGGWDPRRTLTPRKINGQYDSSEDRIQRETTAEAEWTAEEERALVRKLDLRVLFPCCFIYFLAYVDRGNLGNVKIFGAGTPISLGKSLGLKGIDFNLVVSIIYFAVTIGLLSSNILMKKYLAKIFFPIIVVIWGAIVLSVVDTAGVVIFCNTSETFERLVGAFNPHGFSISAMYGDLTSVEQATITKDFRSGTPHTLLATNMLARGISVPLSASVVNFGLPAVYKDCIYRTSFSAPFDRNGVTVNLLTTADVCKAHNIEQYYNTKMGETTIHFQARHQSPKSYTPSPYKGLPSDFH